MPWTNVHQPSGRLSNPMPATANSPTPYINNNVPPNRFCLSFWPAIHRMVIKRSTGANEISHQNGKMAKAATSLMIVDGISAFMCVFSRSSSFRTCSPRLSSNEMPADRNQTVAATAGIVCQSPNCLPTATDRAATSTTFASSPSIRKAIAGFRSDWKTAKRLLRTPPDLKQRNAKSTVPQMIVA